MRCVVTGSTGFIGARLAEALLEQGHEVVAFGAENNEWEAARRHRLAQRGVVVQLGTLADRDLLSRLVEGAGVVFHLAAAQHESNVDDQYFHEVNVEGTRRLLEAANAARVGRFLYGSTIGVYGRGTGEPMTETSDTGPENIYGRTKLEAEGVVRASATIPWTIVRISETYGPGDARLLKLFKVVEKGVVPIIGKGRNEHHPVYVDDLVGGLIAAATNPEAVEETFVLAGHEVVSTEAYVAAIAGALGKPLKSVRLPLAPLMLLAVGCETVCRPMKISPPWHRRRMDFFVKRFSFSSAKAERILGYRPATSFDQGAAAAADWYRRNGYLETSPAS